MIWRRVGFTLVDRALRHGSLALGVSLTLATFPPIAAAQTGPVRWEAVAAGSTHGLTQVSADATHVWGVNAAGSIFRRPVDGSGDWQNVCCNLSHVSASGKGWVWGVQAHGSIWKCPKPGAADGSGWKQVDGTAVRISADDTMVWTVDAKGAIRRRPVDGSGSWETVCCSLSDVSASGKGWVWGVQGQTSVWKSRKPGAADGSGWERMDGTAKSVWAGDTHVWILRSDDTIWRRPVDGSGAWEQIPGAFRSIAASSAGWVWGAKADGTIYKANIGAPASPTQVAKGDVVVTPAACPEGKALGTGGACVTEVAFYKEDGMSLNAARTRSLEQGTSLATRSQVETAWEKLGLDVYAYGRLADGLFAVPVQRDFPNFKRGVNPNAIGGNQGYFCVSGCPPEHVRGMDGRCVNQRVMGVIGDVSEVAYGARGSSTPEGYLVQTSPTTWEQQSPDRRGYIARFAESGRDEVSISLRDLTGDETLTIDFYGNEIAGKSGVSKTWLGVILSASNTSDRRWWDRGAAISATGSDVTQVGFGDDTVLGALRNWGDLHQSGPGEWVQVNAGTNGVAARFTEVGRDAQSVSLRSSAGSTIRIDLSEKKVTATSGASTLMDYYKRAAPMARLLWADNVPLPTAEQASQIAMINEQEVTSNQYNLTSPLSRADLNAVMEWIGKEVSAETVPYCWKPDPPYGRGAGHVDKAGCEAAEGKPCEPSGALWYPRCDAGWHAVGCCLCSRNCPTLAEVLQHGQNVKVECGELCALNNDECAMAVKEMVFAPINLALNIVSFGLSGAASSAASAAAKAGASAATGGASAVASSVTKAALSPKWMTLFRVLEKSEKVFDKAKDAYDNFSYMVANVENFQEEITRWSVDYDQHFSDLASYRVERIIDQHFPDRDDRSYIKQKYGQYQLTTMLEADGWRIANTVGTFASFEPSGIVSVIQAFAHPVCRKGAVPFPAVTVLPKAGRVPDRTTRYRER